MGRNETESSWILTAGVTVGLTPPLYRFFIRLRELNSDDIHDCIVDGSLNSSIQPGLPI